MAINTVTHSVSHTKAYRIPQDSDFSPWLIIFSKFRIGEVLIHIILRVISSGLKHAHRGLPVACDQARESRASI